MKVRETIAMVNRWHDSDDWKPWTPTTFEDEVRRLDDPDASRPEIIANEIKYRQQLQNATTAHCRVSALSGRDTLEPSQIEKSAVAILYVWRSESDSTQYSNDQGPLDSCVPMLTMAAAREDPQQDAHGTPCMPKPRRQLSLRLIMTTLSALDIYPPTRYQRLGSAYSSKSRNPASAPSRIQKSGLRSR